MVIATTHPAAVEGSEIIIHSKKIVPQKGRPVLFNGVMLFKLGAERGAKATINTEYNPKVQIIRSHSLLNIGDAISGKSLLGWSSTLVKLDMIAVGGDARSAAHSNQELLLRGRICCMGLITSWSNVSLPAAGLNQILN